MRQEYLNYRESLRGEPAFIPWGQHSEVEGTLVAFFPLDVHWAAVSAPEGYTFQ